MSETGLHENPLVPNTKLRQMYMAMADSESAGRAYRWTAEEGGEGTAEAGVHTGQEACRVSTAIDLGPGDLMSDSQPGVVMDLFRGAKIDSLLKRMAALHSGKKSKEEAGE